MARTRNIKPGFFLNEELAECEPLARLLFAGLWLIADREGRMEDRPKRIKAEILPYDDCDIEKLLDSLAKYDFILRYEVDGKRFIEVQNFNKHQHIVGTEAQSVLPAPAKAKSKVEKKQNKLEKKSNLLEKKSNKVKKESEQLEEIAPESLISNLESRILNPESLNLNPELKTSSSKKDDLEVIHTSPPKGKENWKVRFAEFWAIYPRKAGKGEAEKSYSKINPSMELHKKILKAVQVACTSRQWRRDNGQFIPYPATWLNQRRWEDEIQDDCTYNEQAAIADRAIAMAEQLERRDTG